MIQLVNLTCLVNAVHLYTSWCVRYLFYHFTMTHTVLYLGVWSIHGYFTCAQQGQRKCRSDKGGNKRKRNATDLETKKIIKHKKMKCWPQHVHQTYPIWQSLLMDKNKCQALKGSAPRTATINKEAEEDCVCMCTHVHARMCVHVPTVLFQQPGCTLFWNSLTKSTDNCVIFSSLGPQNIAGILKFKTLAKHSNTFTSGSAMKNMNNLKRCLIQITSHQQIFMGMDCLKWRGLVIIQLACHILINKLLIMSIFTHVGNVLLSGSGEQHENHSDPRCSQLKYVS